RLCEFHRVLTGSCADVVPALDVGYELVPGPETLPGADLHDPIRVVDRVRNVRQLNRETDHLVTFESGEPGGLRSGDVAVLLVPSEGVRRQRNRPDRRTERRPCRCYAVSCFRGYMRVSFALPSNYHDICANDRDLLARNRPVLGRRPAKMVEPTLCV